MAFLDKINSFASAATEKATSAIESGKLNLKIGGEQKKISDATTRMGVYLLQTLDEGQEYDATIMSLYADVVAARASIAEIREEIAVVNGLVLCENCNAESSKGSKYCRECGSQFPLILLDPPISEDTPVCKSCQTPVEEGTTFCTQCGKKIDE